MALGDSAKADQIAFHIYTKLFHVLYAARASEQAPGPGQGKTDKWFNLETPLAPSASTPTLELDAFRALSASPPPPQRALAVQILLVVPPPGGGTALVHKASGTRVEPEPRFVLLEEWVLAFAASSASSISTSAASTSSASTSLSASDTATSRSSSTDDESSADVLPPTIYKNAIPLFRALYALLRILPAWRVVRKLTSRRAPLGAGGGPQAQGKRGLRVVVRLRPESSEGMRMGGNGGGETTLSFGESPAPEAGAPPLPTSTHVFPGIQHPAGTLTLSATYLTTPAFSLESLEALLSSRFAVLDARPGPREREGGYGYDPVSPTRADAGGSRSGRREPSGDYNYGTTTNPSGRTRTASTSGYTVHQQEDDEDAEFVPTLARRSITTSTTSTLSAGAGATSTSPGRYTSPLPPTGSPGRYTSPLPPVGAGSGSPGRYNSPLPPVGAGSPGRYTSALAMRPRVESLRGEGSSYRADSPSSYRVDSPSAYSPTAYRVDSPYRERTPSEASYRMGVHVAPGHRRESSTGYAGAGGVGGADVVDRFVLPRSGASSLSTTSTTSPLALRRDEGAGVGGEYTSGYGYASGRPLPSEREREREREKGVPIGGGGGGGSFPFGAGVGMGLPSSTSAGGIGTAGGSGSSGAGAGGISGSAPIAINPFKSNTLSRSSLSGSLLRTVGGGGGVAGSPGRSGSGATSPMGVVFPAHTPSPAPSTMSGVSGEGASTSAGSASGVGIPMRKRYSSSFPHRYAAGSSVGSGGSGESGSASASGSVPPPPGMGTRERTASGSRSRSGSFLKSPLDAQTQAQQDDNDISAFVKEIDAARPLLGRYRHLQEQQQGADPRRGLNLNPDLPPRPRDDDLDLDPDDPYVGDGDNGDNGDTSSSSSPGTSRGGTVRGGSTFTPSAARTVTMTPGPAAAEAGAMLTSADEVEARLRRMNEEFMQSLVGLGGGGGGASRASGMMRGEGPGSAGSGSASASTMGGSGSGSGGSGSAGQGSDEVLGRLELDFDSRPGRGHGRR